MADKFSERGRAFEDEHFRRREEELIHKMRQRAEARADRQGMAAATGVDDESILSDLQALGFNRETVQLVHLVPLVQVAWADGAIAPGERDMILEAAATHGISEGTPAHDRLLEMLERRPSEDLFDEALRVVRIILKASGGSEATAPEDFVAYCTRIAEASGGFLGIGKVSGEERALIARISRALEREHAEGAKKVVDRG